MSFPNREQMERQIRKRSKKIEEFIRKVEAAQKRTAKSKLVFGPGHKETGKKQQTKKRRVKEKVMDFKLKPIEECIHLLKQAVVDAEKFERQMEQMRRDQNGSQTGHLRFNI